MVCVEILKTAFQTTSNVLKKKKKGGEGEVAKGFCDAGEVLL